MIWYVLSPLIALVVGILLMGLSRKLLARIHWRVGPPILQPVIDLIRFLSQKSASHGFLFDSGLILSLAGSLVLTLFLPLGQYTPMSGSGGLLVILYVMLLGPLGIAFSSGGAANPYASIGISRKLMLAMGYELPLLLIVLTVMTGYRTISIVEVVRIQQAQGWAIATFPLLLSALAYILILPAILGMRPFEVVGAAQEISSGPVVEFGGPHLALSTLQHALTTYIGLSLFVNLMLGGGSNPVFFLLKMLVVFVLCLCVHAVFPRFRVDQAIRYLWRWPALVAMAGLVLTVLMGG